MMPDIFVFIALGCEAKPLVKAWRLKKQTGKHPFAIYTDARRVVVVTGVGKVAMAGAIGYTLAMFQGARQLILLNLGIAGHRRHSVGSLFLADKIIDAETQRRFFPQIPFSSPCPTLAVTSQPQPCDVYAEDCLYDMEASAFYEMAVKFSTTELIHCLKIVSDNSNSPMSDISEAAVEAWCEGQLSRIDSLLNELAVLRQSLPLIDLNGDRELFERFHVTAANEVKLKALLERWRLQMAGLPLRWQDAEARSVGELMIWIEKRLDGAEFYL